MGEGHSAERYSFKVSHTLLWHHGYVSAMAQQQCFYVLVEWEPSSGKVDKGLEELSLPSVAVSIVEVEEYSSKFSVITFISHSFV